MTNKYKNFIIFNVNQVGAAKAMAEIDCSMGAGNPILYGDVCCVGFWVNSSYKSDDKYAKEQKEKTEKILKKYNVKYKYSTFNV